MRFPATLLATLLLLTISLLQGCEKMAPPQQFRVGIINPSSGLAEVVDGFKLGLTEHGFKVGENLTIIEAGPIKMNEVSAAIKDLQAQNIDLLYITTTRASQIAKQAVAGTNLPVVFAPVFSPVTSNLVASLHSPGGNLTGIKVGGSSAKTFHWLLTIMPDITHVFVPFHCTDPAATICFNDLSEAAKKAGITVDYANVTSKTELEAALTDIPQETDAIWLSCSPLIFSNIKEIVAAAMARKLPVASTTHQQEEGVVISYGVNNIALGRQASRLAAQILQGTTPAEIPVETAEFFLSINLPIADQLGIEIPTHVLQRADFIIRKKPVAQPLQRSPTRDSPDL